MPRDEKRRQRALQRKAAKRKEKHRVAKQQVVPSSQRAVLRRAAHWPVYECLISQRWRNVDGIAEVLVARRSSSGQIAAAAFLVDLGCLGVKSAFGRVCDSTGEYDEMRQVVGQDQKMVKADLNLAAKIVREALAYARSLGFSADPDYFALAPLLFEGADPDAATEDVPLGKEGKPFFVAGPYDNVPRIMAQLTRGVGPDNFNYVVPIPMDAAEQLFEDEDDGDEEDDEWVDEAGEPATDERGAGETQRGRGLFGWRPPLLKRS